PEERSTPPEMITMQAPMAAMPTNDASLNSWGSSSERRNESWVLTRLAISQAISIATRTSAVPNSRVRQKRKPVTGAHGAPAAGPGSSKTKEIGTDRNLFANDQKAHRADRLQAEYRKRSFLHAQRSCLCRNSPDAGRSPGRAGEGRQVGEGHRGVRGEGQDLPAPAERDRLRRQLDDPDVGDGRGVPRSQGDQPRVRRLGDRR